MLINVEMPTIVGILTFMSRINFVLSRVEYEKGFLEPENATRQTTDQPMEPYLDNVSLEQRGRETRI